MRRVILKIARQLVLGKMIMLRGLSLIIKLIDL